jgi:hypothetical protein
MRQFFKFSLALAAVAFLATAAPAVKADALTISTGGFNLQNLGNDGTGVPGMDSLAGAANTTTHQITGMDSFVALLNPMTFTTGFTGLNSGGPHPFTFSQAITINGQTQMLDLVGRIDIDQFVDTVHILSATPLTFNFDTFSVVVDIIPTSIQGWGEGTFCADLRARITVDNCNPVPEPATLTLLGIGLMGAAAKLRQRRESKNAS